MDQYPLSRCLLRDRLKNNVKLQILGVRTEPLDFGDGFMIVEDALVRLATQGRARLPIPLRIALRLCGYPMPVIRFAHLVRDCLFARKALAEIDKPPDTYSPRWKSDPNQFLLEIS